LEVIKVINLFEILSKCQYFEGLHLGQPHTAPSLVNALIRAASMEVVLSSAVGENVKLGAILSSMVADCVGNLIESWGFGGLGGLEAVESGTNLTAPCKKFRNNQNVYRKMVHEHIYLAGRLIANDCEYWKVVRHYKLQVYYQPKSMIIALCQ
jgi:hypothetical protein